VAITAKSDLASPERMVEHLLSIAELETSLDIDWADVVPVSVPERF
jgi:GTP-binding protein Era